MNLEPGTDSNSTTHDLWWTTQTQFRHSAKQLHHLCSTDRQLLRGRIRTASLGCLTRTLICRKLDWLSVVLFIYYFAQSTDTGCAVTGFQTLLWAAPCWGLQLSAVLCTLVLQECVLPLPHPHLLIWHCRIALPLSCSDPHRIAIFFQLHTWCCLQTTQHFLYHVPKMGEKSLKLELQKDRCYWGSAAHGDKTLLPTKGPIYPTQRHSSSKRSLYKKPKHSPRWCWASPRWSQRGTLLMSPGTGHLEAQRCKMSALPDALWQRHSSIKTMLVPMPHISFIISSNHPLFFLPPSTWEAWAMLGHLFPNTTWVRAEDISELFSHYRDLVLLLY